MTLAGGVRSSPQLAPAFKCGAPTFCAARHAGLDAFTFLLFIRTLFQALAGYGVYAVLVPLSAYVASSFNAPVVCVIDGVVINVTNSTNGTLCESVYPPGGLPKTSIANIISWEADNWWEESGWDRWYPMMASLAGVYLLTCWTYYLLHRAWRIVVFRRQRYMAEARDASSMAVLVGRAGRDGLGPAAGRCSWPWIELGGPLRGLHGGGRRLLAWVAARPRAEPALLRSARQVRSGPYDKPRTREEIAAEWEELYPGEVWGVFVVREAGDLPKLVAKWTPLHKRLAKADRRAAKAAEDPEKAAKAAKGGGGCCASAAKAQRKLEADRKKLAELEKQIVEKLKVERAPERDMGLHYFVCFRSQRATNLAKQVPPARSA